jgi:tetratricopeptide (TPR) repeat protein
VAKWAGRKTFDLENTATWYPHCGVVDRATYDVTLRWPKRLQLIASGRLIDSGQRGDFRWERRVLERPSLAFSFALGEFLVERRRSGRIELIMAFNRNTQWRTTPELRARAMDTVEDSLHFFEELFGPYPLDQLTLVTLPRLYSQSYPGFITLTDTVVRSVTTTDKETMDWLRADTIAHEVSHQWWGNRLGWASYRDQWLSEGMANYSSLLFLTRNSENSRSALAESSAMWRNSLTRPTLGGRTLESLGPVVLGPRLNSSLANDGYRAIVYRKGAVVLAMLARTIGEKQFLEMMRALAEAADYRVISTEDFIAAIEHMSRMELTDFAHRYIYGTGVPNVYYDYEVIKEGAGGYRVRGIAHWLAEPQYTHRIKRTDSGGWDLQRKTVRRPISADSGLMVPFRIVLGADGSDEEFIARQGTAARSLLEGLVLLQAEQARFEIETESRPIAFELDPLGEILAYFHSEPTHPRRVSRFRAEDLMARGDLAEAERAFRQALQLPLPQPVATDGLPWMNDPDVQARRDDASIRLALARLYLRQKRVDDAQGELDSVAELMDSDRVTLRVERDVLQSHVEIAQGAYEPAYRRLKKTLKLAAPREGSRGWRAAVWKMQLASERLAVIEAYMLLAVAAYETGHTEDAHWAAQEAREHGADLRALTGLLAS